MGWCPLEAMFLSLANFCQHTIFNFNFKKLKIIFFEAFYLLNVNFYSEKKSIDAPIYLFFNILCIAKFS
jgi:hypothetical protein